MIQWEEKPSVKRDSMTSIPHPNQPGERFVRNEDFAVWADRLEEFISRVESRLDRLEETFRA